MARKRNPKRDEAYQIYADSGGQVKLADIAAQLNIPDVRIRKWKSVDKWEEKIRERSNSANGNVPFRDDKGRFLEGNTAAVGHGAPEGNNNSAGHRPSVPPRNQNAAKHGFYSRFIPAEDVEILQDAPGAGELERELKLARYKLARLIDYQDKRRMTGLIVGSYGADTVTLQDDFYEPLIQKQIKLISDIEIKLYKMADDKLANNEDSTKEFLDALKTSAKEVWVK